MATATSSLPAPKTQHPEAAGGGVMTVGTQQGGAGNAEPFQVDLVADAVAGTGEINTVPRGNALEKPVVVGIFKAGP